MIPNAADIVRWRAIVAVVLRVAAVFCFPFGFIPIGLWLIEGVADGDLLDLYYYAVNIVSGFILIVFPVGLFLTAGLIARLVVPLRIAPACPGCGYSAVALTGSNCPECGLALGPGFVQSTPSGAEESVQVTRLRVQFVVICRAGTAIVNLLFGSLGSYLLHAQDYWMYYGGFDVLITMMTFMGLMFLGSLLFWLLTPLLARLAIPRSLVTRVAVVHTRTHTPDPQTGNPPPVAPPTEPAP